MKTQRNVSSALLLAGLNFCLILAMCMLAGAGAGVACMFAVPVVVLVASAKMWRDERRRRCEPAVAPHPIDLDENPIGVSCLYRIATQGSWPRMGFPVALLRLVQAGYARFAYDDGGLVVELENAREPTDELDSEARRLFQKLASGTNRFRMADIAGFAQEHRQHYAALCKSWVAAVKSSKEFEGFGFSLREASRSSCLIALAPDIVLGILIVSMGLDAPGDDIRVAALSVLLVVICVAASVFWYQARAEAFDVSERGRCVLAECDAYVRWLEGDAVKGELAAMGGGRLRELQLWAVALGVAEGVAFPEPDLASLEDAGVHRLAVDGTSPGIHHILYSRELHSEIDDAFSDANESALGSSDGFSSSVDAGSFGGGDFGGDSGGCGGCGGGCGGCGGD